VERAAATSPVFQAAVSIEFGQIDESFGIVRRLAGGSFEQFDRARREIAALLMGPRDGVGEAQVTCRRGGSAERDQCGGGME
jgi:hypothetical protein